MSLPANGGTAFTTARIVDYWRVYPFAHDGDTVTVEYKFRIQVDSDSYTAPSFTDVLSNAATVKVVQIPVVDLTAHFVGDIGFQSGEGNTTFFTRTYAQTGATRTRGNGSFSHSWPAFRKWNDDVQTGNNEAFNIDDEDYVGGPPEFVIRGAVSASSPSTVTYTYTYSASGISGVSKDTIWTPEYGSSSNYHDFQNQKTEFLVNAGSGGSPLGTDVDQDDYEDDYINKRYEIVSSSIDQYKGNIFVKRTIKALAQ